MFDPLPTTPTPLLQHQPSAEVDILPYIYIVIIMPGKKQNSLISCAMNFLCWCNSKYSRGRLQHIQNQKNEKYTQNMRSGNIILFISDVMLYTA